MEFLYRVMEEMEKKLRNAVKKVDSSMDVRINRVFGERKLAGFRIVNEKGEKVAGVDLSVRQNRFCRPYISYVNGVSINGASVLKMLSDKVYAISGEQVCRRMKDILDIYVLSFITEIDAGEMYRIWEETGRKPGNFEIFRTKSAELKEAYDKMKGVKNKPDFIDVYTRVNDVIETLGL